MARTAPKNVHLRRGGKQCRNCGCTDDRACPGGCTWVLEDLCSRCMASFEKSALPLFGAAAEASPVSLCCDDCDPAEDDAGNGYCFACGHPLTNEQLEEADRRIADRDEVRQVEGAVLEQLVGGGRHG